MIKKGQILQNKDSSYERKVLEVYGDIYFLSGSNDFESVSGTFTIKDIKTLGYIIPKEEWEPEDDDDYYYIDSSGGINVTCWTGTSSEISRKSFLGVYKTKAEAEQALEEIKKKLSR